MGSILTQNETNTVWGWLMALKPMIAMAAPKHLTPDRVLRIAMTSVQRTPKLAQCTRESLLGAVLTCSQLGLEPDSASGRAYLIPYGRECTLIIGYRGLMELARRSGEILSIEARAVHENDEFDYAYGTDSHCTHKPYTGDSPGKMVAAYAVARFKDGGHHFEVMSRTQIDAIRDRSKAKSAGTPWQTDYEEMARKSVVRRLCKYLPSSPELQTAVSIDERAEVGLPQNIDFIDVAAASKPTPTRTEALADKLGSKQQTPTPPPPPTPALKSPEQASGPKKGRARVDAQVEQMKARDDKRSSIRKSFAGKSVEQQATALKNAGLGDMSEIDRITNLDELQSIQDVLISV